MKTRKRCLICNSSKIKYEFSYRNNTQRGERKWYRCYNCLAFNGDNIKIRQLYEKQYYPSLEYIKQRFDYVNSLPDHESNNHYRVQRLREYIRIYEKLGLLNGKKRKMLDVGCGFGIFIFKFLKDETTWDAIGLDLDVKLKDFLKSIGIKMIASRSLQGLKQHFDMITFNRVLEHTKKPLLLLREASSILKDTGVIYIEVPDTLAYSLQGKKSDMFTDDHYCVFSPKSIFILAEKANLKLLNLSRIREINDKITLYAFFSKTG